MFKSMKMYLKNKLTDSEELMKIQGKLHKFLGLNPEVDQYLVAETNRKTAAWLIIGFIFGFLLAFLVLFAFIWMQLDIWHAQGYLKLPGSFLWGSNKWVM